MADRKPPLRCPVAIPGVSRVMANSPLYPTADSTPRQAGWFPDGDQGAAAMMRPLTSGGGGAGDSSARSG